MTRANIDSPLSELSTASAGMSAKPTATVLYGSVLDELGTAITSGVLKEGDIVTLDQLQQRFAVSRTIAREVMRILESMNLVESRRRVGLVVQKASKWLVFDSRIIRWRIDGPDRFAQLHSLTELRVVVEPAAAAAAARNATAEERERIVHLAALMRETGEAEELETFLQLDIEFHALILHASGNEMFAALTDMVVEVLAGRTHHGLMPSSPVSEALDAHEQIARAIFDGDENLAESAMKFATTEVRQALRDGEY